MSNSHRKMTPKGHMSSNGSGPAVMMMPPNIRATFMPDPPLGYLPPPKRKRPKAYTEDGSHVTGDVIAPSADAKDGPNASTTGVVSKNRGLSGVASFMAQFERTPASKRISLPTPKSIKEAKQAKKLEATKQMQQPDIEAYQKEQRESGGEFQNMNCYNTLFVGRLAYEVTERKLLREFESFGAVKDIKLVKVASSGDRGDGNGTENSREGKSRGYAFVEFEQEDDMKRAYRAADGMRIEGKEIVVDVERGHTVPNWLPRRFGGGLGGTRLGSKEKNVTRPGRFDPSRPRPSIAQGQGNGPPPGFNDGGGYGGGGPRGGYDRGGGPGYRSGGPGYGHGPPPGRGGYDDRGQPGYGGGGYGGGPRGGYDDRGPPPGHRDRDRGGPPRRDYGPPPDRYGGGDRGPRYGGDRNMKRGREYDDRGGNYRRRY